MTTKQTKIHRTYDDAFQEANMLGLEDPVVYARRSWAGDAEYVSVTRGILPVTGSWDDWRWLRFDCPKSELDLGYEDLTLEEKVTYMKENSSIQDPDPTVQYEMKTPIGVIKWNYWDEIGFVTKKYYQENDPSLLLEQTGPGNDPFMLLSLEEQTRYVKKHLKYILLDCFQFFSFEEINSIDETYTRDLLCNRFDRRVVDSIDQKEWGSSWVFLKSAKGNDDERTHDPTVVKIFFNDTGLPLPSWDGEYEWWTDPPIEDDFINYDDMVVKYQKVLECLQRATMYAESSESRSRFAAWTQTDCGTYVAVFERHSHPHPLTN